MNKIGLITHVADADGAFPIILSKIVFENVDIFSCEVDEVNDILENVLKNSFEYEMIYIVDVNINENMAKKIAEDRTLKEKIKIFDHHQSNLFLNTYNFIQVVDEINGKKECGTTLFYKYLRENFYKELLDKPCLKTMIELVRQGDTYDFTEELKEMSFQFGSLYNIYGREKYIEHFYQYILENDIFVLSELDTILIKMEEERTKRYIEEKMKHVHLAKIEGISVGIVFAEQKRSLLGHAMAKNLDIDIAIIIDVDRSVSYRADKENIDVSILAVPYGGGGHKHAGGSSLPLDLHKRICEIIFQNVEW